jgi:hypothetical protein
MVKTTILALWESVYQGMCIHDRWGNMQYFCQRISPSPGVPHLSDTVASLKIGYKNHQSC